MGIWLRFHEVVNLGDSELEAWLQTDESLAVGFRRNGGESVGHASGRRIVSLLRKADRDLTADDYRHMRKVVGTSIGIWHSGRGVTSPGHDGATRC
jgi:Protein of unknown function (DUF3140).